MSEMPVTKTPIAIIGLGMASAPHARSLLDLADRVNVVAAFSPTAARRDKFADAYGFPVTGDLDAIIADPAIKAVLVLTPPNTHLDLVEKLARAGKHILLEKPLEISVERAEAVVNAAKAAGVIVGIVFQNRFREASLALRQVIEDRRLGEIVGASVRLTSWRPQSYYDEPGRGTWARDGGGVLLTQAIHPIDLLISLAGLPVEVTAFAATSAIHRMETEDTVAGALRFTNGAIGTISATTTAYPGSDEEIEITGTKGRARLVGAALDIGFHDGTALKVDAGSLSSGTGADPMAFSHDTHRALIADFLDAVEHGTMPAVSAIDALKAHYLIDALLGSASAGTSVAVRTV